MIPLEVLTPQVPSSFSQGAFVNFGKVVARVSSGHRFDAGFKWECVIPQVFFLVPFDSQSQEIFPKLNSGEEVELCGRKLLEHATDCFLRSHSKVKNDQTDPGPAPNVWEQAQNSP